MVHTVAAMSRIFHSSFIRSVVIISQYIIVIVVIIIIIISSSSSSIYIGKDTFQIEDEGKAAEEKEQKEKTNKQRTTKSRKQQIPRRLHTRQNKPCRAHR